MREFCRIALAVDIGKNVSTHGWVTFDDGVCIGHNVPSSMTSAHLRRPE